MRSRTPQKKKIPTPPEITQSRLDFFEKLRKSELRAFEIATKRRKGEIQSYGKNYSGIWNQLVSRLVSPNVEKRLTALRTLRVLATQEKVSRKRALQTFIHTIRFDASSTVQIEAGHQLGRLQLHEAIPNLKTILLNEKKLTTRAAAIHALDLLGDKKSIPFLQRLLEEKPPKGYELEFEYFLTVTREAIHHIQNRENRE